MSQASILLNRGLWLTYVHLSGEIQSFRSRIILANALAEVNHSLSETS